MKTFVDATNARMEKLIAGISFVHSWLGFPAFHSCIRGFDFQHFIRIILAGWNERGALRPLLSKNLLEKDLSLVRLNLQMITKLAERYVIVYRFFVSSFDSTHDPFARSIVFAGDPLYVFTTY